MAETPSPAGEALARGEQALRSQIQSKVRRSATLQPTPETDVLPRIKHHRLGAERPYLQATRRGFLVAVRFAAVLLPDKWARNSVGDWPNTRLNMRLN